MPGSMVDSGIVDSGSDGQERLDRLVGTLVAVLAYDGCGGCVGGEGPRPALAGEGFVLGERVRRREPVVGRGGRRGLVVVWVGGSQRGPADLLAVTTGGRGIPRLPRNRGRHCRSQRFPPHSVRSFPVGWKPMNRISDSRSSVYEGDVCTVRRTYLGRSIGCLC